VLVGSIRGLKAKKIKVAFNDQVSRTV
jgi:hypothetical protein